MPFFHEPCLDANINFKLPLVLLPQSENGTQNNEYIPYGTFFLNKLPIFSEYAALCDALPQWMVEKYISNPSHKKVLCWATTQGIKIDEMNFQQRKKLKK